MPKKTPVRIIDNRKANRTTTISGVTLAAPATGVSDHGLLLGLGDDDHPQYLLADGTRALTGNLAVGVGVTIDDVDLSAHAADASAHHAPVTAGTLIGLSGQQVSVAAGANYQFVGTGSGTAAGWRNVSEMAGAGLISSAGVLEVGAGAGLTVSADAIALTNPGTLTVSTSNDNAGSHTHAITSASNPGAAASILATDSAGLTQLVQLASNATFASGFAGSGYRVDYGVTEASKASAEFDNLTVRGRMRVYELLIQQIRATNGSVFVTSTGKAKSVATTDDPPWTINGNPLTLNGSPANLETTLYTIFTSDSTEDAGDKSLYHGFLPGDILRAQRVEWNGSAFGGIYQSNLEATEIIDLYSFTAARVATGDSTPAMGYEYVRLGNATDSTRRGTIYLASDDSNAPFIDIVDTVRSHAEWNTAGKIKVRLGRLSGITDSYFGTLSGYGLYSDNVYLRGNIYATSGFFQGTVHATNGSFSGSITAATGTIGGWSIGASVLTTGNGANTVGLDSGGSNPAFYAGDATPASAPFRVTQAGALTATNATITGAITASSGSITGFLTLGSSGGIYQGTGTSGSPTTGLKIWNDSGVGRIGGYSSGVLEWYASTTGRIYSGRGTMRLGYDDIRLKHENAFDDLRSVKWVQDIDFTGDLTDLNSANGAYAYMGAYTYASNTVSELYISHRVNNIGSPSRTQHSMISLVPTRREGSTNYSGRLQLVSLNSTYNYDVGALFTDMFIEIGNIANTPTWGLNASTGAQVYVKGGFFVIRYNDGGTYRYKYLDLTGTGSSWTHSTSAP